MFVRTFSMCFLAGICCGNLKASDQPTDIFERVSADIKYLASDELEGRGVETEGIEKAAARITDVYRKAGLKPANGDSYRQEFPITLGKTVVGKDTKIELTAPDGSVVKLTQGEQYNPLQIGGSGDVSGEVVFVGYGISSTEDAYDDYEGIDVKGKIIVMIRREPLQKMNVAKFRGRRTSPHAYINAKTALAAKAGAAAILFVNDPTTTRNGKDGLTPPNGFGANGKGAPFFHVSQESINSMLEKSPITVERDGETTELTSLEQIEKDIDTHVKPLSQPLTGWKASVAVEFKTDSINAFNLVGILEGEGPLADEYVVVGAHYDHVGRGSVGSRAPDRKGEVHNGADDNASGTAAVMELARRMSQGPKPKRSVIFACFSGEERGLLGSKYYVKDPLIPLDDTVSMLNFDMIGTLRNNKIDIGGVGTGTGLRAVVSEADELSPLNVKITDNAFAGSDHLPFIQKGVPAMFCFTGMTDRYHTPDDDFDLINVEGAVQVIGFAEDVLRGLADHPVRPKFMSVGRGTRRMPYFGVIPVLSAEEGVKGVRVRIVRKESPAEIADLKVGDLITSVNSVIVSDYEGVIAVLRRLKDGDQIPIEVKRGDESVRLTVKLGHQE